MRTHKITFKRDVYKGSRLWVGYLICDNNTAIYSIVHVCGGLWNIYCLDTGARYASGLKTLKAAKEYFLTNYRA